MSIQSLSNDSQAVEAMNLESAAEQTFDTALDIESENKSVNDVNESMQTSTNVTENNSDDQLCGKILMMISAYISLNTDQTRKQISVLLISKEHIMMALTVILKKNISTEF